MKIADRIPKEQILQLERMKSPKKKQQSGRNLKPNPKTKEKKKENLSFTEIEDLMGKRMPTLHRKRGGAWG